MLIDLGILVAVGLICWLGGRRTAYYYGNGLIWAGMAAMAVGAISFRGGWNMVSGFGYQYARTVGGENAQERTRRDVEDIGRSYAFLVLMSAVGITSIALGKMVQTVFG